MVSRIEEFQIVKMITIKIKQLSPIISFLSLSLCFRIYFGTQRPLGFSQDRCLHYKSSTLPLFPLLITIAGNFQLPVSFSTFHSKSSFKFWSCFLRSHICFDSTMASDLQFRSLSIIWCSLLALVRPRKYLLTTCYEGAYILAKMI